MKIQTFEYNKQLIIIHGKKLTKFYLQGIGWLQNFLMINHFTNEGTAKISWICDRILRNKVKVCLICVVGRLNKGDRRLTTLNSERASITRMKYYCVCYAHGAEMQARKVVLKPLYHFGCRNGSNERKNTYTDYLGARKFRDIRPVNLTVGLFLYPVCECFPYL